MSVIADALGPAGWGTYQITFGEQPFYERVSRPPQGVWVPGFVDVHIHGAYGIDFMSASADQMVDLGRRLARDGYDAFFPTTVTASADAVKSALGNLPDDPMMPGFHLEGPFISPEFPGAQPPDAIESPPLGDSEWDEILDDPRLRLITLAPEQPLAPELALRVMRHSTVVSMGHTNATYDQSRQGFEFGVSHVTHCFNAMRGFHHREAGAVGYALAQDGLTCELIYDRVHVTQAAAALLLKCKPAHKVIAVSDSTMATGWPSGKEGEMWGHAVRVGKDSVRLAEGGALAGSTSTLLDVFRNLVEDFDVETAIRLCSVNPRFEFGMGAPRTYTLFDRDLNIKARYSASGERL